MHPSRGKRGIRIADHTSEGARGCLYLGPREALTIGLLDVGAAQIQHKHMCVMLRDRVPTSLTVNNILRHS